MKIKEQLPKILVTAVVLGGIALVASRFFPQEPTSSKAGLVLPDFSPLAEQGEVAFTKNCAQCHGTNALGTPQGPTFIHPVYNPGHHADEAFVRAVLNGVKQHHWPFGDMPAQPQVSKEELQAIIRYVRELQTANGISYEPHQMN
ncbi:c-type cytochrome [Kiloniella laminariae]|uniref:c-type cytochrome n=1 Tax=Kiloniella laminariae TaxID=454162 RepID=UPI000477231D|nr:cytochrome c [Kiloniella laminariae]